MQTIEKIDIFNLILGGVLLVAGGVHHQLAAIYFGAGAAICGLLAIIMKVLR